jgi:hypothetical protein
MARAQLKSARAVADGLPRARRTSNARGPRDPAAGIVFLDASRYIL